MTVLVSFLLPIVDGGRYSLQEEAPACGTRHPLARAVGLVLRRREQVRSTGMMHVDEID